MAVTTGTVWSVDTLKSAEPSQVQIARVLFFITGTYDQAANSQLLAVDTAIQSARRNGRTVTLLRAMCGDTATKDSNPAAFMAMKTEAVSGSNITFELTDGDFSTELAAAAIPTQHRPFSILVAFTEKDINNSVVGSP